MITKKKKQIAILLARNITEHILLISNNTKNSVICRLSGAWKLALWEKGSRLSRSKTKFTEYEFGEKTKRLTGRGNQWQQIFIHLSPI